MPATKQKKWLMALRTSPARDLPCMPEDHDYSQPKLTANKFLQVIEDSDALADSVNGRRERKEKQNIAKWPTAKSGAEHRWR